MIFVNNLMLLVVSLLVLPLVLCFAVLCGIANIFDVRDADMWAINKHMTALITDFIC